jgi:DNA end-binding protein Ku
MKALRRSVGASEQARASKPSKKPRKEASGQKEMLMPNRGQEDS